MQTHCIILYFIRQKPGETSKYYAKKYADLFNLTDLDKVYNVGVSKWFSKLRKEGYIVSEQRNRCIYHYPTNKEWIDNRVYLDESDGWNLVDKNGELHRRNNDE